MAPAAEWQQGRRPWDRSRSRCRAGRGRGKDSDAGGTPPWRSGAAHSNQAAREEGPKSHPLASEADGAAARTAEPTAREPGALAFGSELGRGRGQEWQRAEGPLGQPCGGQQAELPRRAEGQEPARKPALRPPSRTGRQRQRQVDVRALRAKLSGSEAAEPKGGSEPPTWVRWKEMQWEGKNLSEVALDLKKQMLQHPGWIGDFCRAAQQPAAPAAGWDPGRRTGSRNILPLPVPLLSEEEEQYTARQEGRQFPGMGDKSDPVLQHAAGAKAWLWLLVQSLNYMHSGRGQAAAQAGPIQGPPTAAQEAALAGLEKDVLYFLEVNKGKLPKVDWERQLSTRRVRYDGEEIGAARPLTLRQVQPALPTPGNCGKICATEIASGQVREVLLHPELVVLPADKWPKTGLRARCMHNPEERKALVEELYGRGMCDILACARIAKGPLGELLNGWFGVGKGKYLPGEIESELTEILRLIMHFVPVNSIMDAITGDVSALPYMGQWTSLQLLSWQYFAWSAEDIACMFYIFRLPRVWQPYMAFNCGEVQLLQKDGSTLSGRLCARVLGMGWLSSVGVAQHLIRELTLRAPKLGAGLPAAAELRRDTDLPKASKAGRAAFEFWSVYLDDWDHFEAGEKAEILAAVGDVSHWQRAVREAYAAWGIPRGEDKAICRSLRVERLGAFLDGVAGKATGTEKKLGMILSVALFFLQQGRPAKTLLEMVLGRLMHRMQFRRATMGTLARTWKYLRRWGMERAVPSEVEEDLLLSLSLLPAMAMDFRCPVSGTVTCSDASPSGCGVCVASQLTPQGRGLYRQLLEPPERSGSSGVYVVLVSLFDGIGGLRRATDVLGLAVYGAAAVESNERCRRVTAHAWPDTVEFADVRGFGEVEIRGLRLKFPRATMVILGAGFPCQEFSGLNASRRGLASERGSLVEEVPRIRRELELSFQVPVHLFGECVASMQTDQLQAINEILGVTPIQICSGECSWCRRPRLYWISWPVNEEPGVTLEEGRDKNKARLHAERPPLRSWAQRGVEPCGDGPFLTFTRAIPEKKPGHKMRGIERVNDEEKEIWANERYRFAPYQYQRHNLVDYKGGLRSLNATEREAILGFEVGHTATIFTKQEQGQAHAYEDARVEALGNSWSIPVAAWLLQQLWLQVDPARAALGLQDVVRRCCPARYRLVSADEAHKHRGHSAQELAELLFRSVDHTGGLLRKAPGSTEVPHIAPMRSLDPRSWRWRTVVSWAWPEEVTEEHINKLELRALLTALRWRVRTPGLQGTRVLHLCDSRVSIGVAQRARSGSFALQSISDKVNATVIAGRVRLVLAHVRSKLNPADGPSRRNFKVRPSIAKSKASSWKGLARAHLADPQ